MDTQKTKQSEETQLALMANDIGYIRQNIVEIKKSQENYSALYVTQVEFKPVRQIVYGLVTLILTAVVMAVIALVIYHK